MARCVRSSCPFFVEIAAEVRIFSFVSFPHVFSADPCFDVHRTSDTTPVEKMPEDGCFFPG